jgi:hypothetical protein
MALSTRRRSAVRLRFHKEVEMNTHGIVALSNFEIDRVAGGKSSVMDRFWDSIARWLDGMGDPPGTCAVPLRVPDIEVLARMFEGSGGSILQTGSLAEGTMNIRLTSGDGTYTVVNVTNTTL